MGGCNAFSTTQGFIHEENVLKIESLPNTFRTQIDAW